MARRCFLALAFASVFLAGCASSQKGTVSPWSNVSDTNSDFSGAGSKKAASNESWFDSGDMSSLASSLNGLKGK